MTAADGAVPPRLPGHGATNFIMKTRPPLPSPCFPLYSLAYITWLPLMSVHFTLAFILAPFPNKHGSCLEQHKCQMKYWNVFKLWTFVLVSSDSGRFGFKTNLCFITFCLSVDKRYALCLAVIMFQLLISVPWNYATLIKYCCFRSGILWWPLHSKSDFYLWCSYSQSVACATKAIKFITCFIIKEKPFG